MVSVMLLVSGDIFAALQAGLEFFGRHYTVSPDCLWVHPELKVPDGLNLVVKAERYVYSPKIIYLGYEENKPERPQDSTRSATTD